MRRRGLARRSVTFGIGIGIGFGANVEFDSDSDPDVARVPVRNRQLRRERCRMPLTQTERPTKLIRRGGLTITDRFTRVTVVVSFFVSVVERR